MQMAVPAVLETMTWLGRGPHENYWDRNTAPPWASTPGAVEDLVHVYVRPQENGNRTDVRWVALTGADGTGLLASGMPLLSVSAWPFTMADLEKATHVNELPRRDSITLNLDHRQMGVGGDDGWGARPHPEYTLDAKAVHLPLPAPAVRAVPGAARRGGATRSPGALRGRARMRLMTPPSASRRRFTLSLRAALGATVVRPKVSTAVTAGPADPAVVDLSSNENPYGPSPGRSRP